jgi:uncharacterized low-complexity protein
MDRMKIAAFAAGVAVLTLTVVSAGAQDRTRQTNALKNAYKMLLAEADKNKDGKLSIAECSAAWKDKTTGEEKCKYWDANGDGVITEEEYVQQGLKLMK